MDLKASSGSPHSSSSADRPVASASTRATVAIRFRIGGVLRFLSHAETLRVFERAFARSVVPVRYTEGFNPHAKLSLPLPRPVGVRSDDELLVARLTGDFGDRRLDDRSGYETAVKEALAEQVPEGIGVFQVALAAPNASFQPQWAEYVLPIRTAGAADLVGALNERIAGVMMSTTCMVERIAPEGKAIRRIDVRPFLRSVRLEGADLVVQHSIGTAGSIRVDEILQLFGLQVQDLAGPVRRTNVTWETTTLQIDHSRTI
jgi:radical SAM-linked protein